MKIFDQLEWVDSCARLFLTFDVEDFVNHGSIGALHKILLILQKHDLKGQFFITGHMAEKLSDFPEILDLLGANEIGYHSSSHSVRPTIPEYTDVEDYKEAYFRALQRETSHINPLTGKVEREDGINFLRVLFPKKSIVSFRAPGGCWSPPHLEALAKLGIKFDFSANISPKPVSYKNITFFPASVLIDYFDVSVYTRLIYHALKSKIVVLVSHPNSFTNRKAWDSIYYKDNPSKISGVPQKNQAETKSMFQKFESLLRKIKLLQEMNAIEVTPTLTKSNRVISITKADAEKAYEKSVWWAKRFFGYEPRFLRSHFFHYFTQATCGN